MHFLHTLPFDHSRPEAQWLVDRLATMFWKVDRIIPLLQNAGLSIDELRLDNPARIVWMDALTQARAEGKLEALLDLVAADPGCAALHADLAVLRATGVLP